MNLEDTLKKNITSIKLLEAKNDLQSKSEIISLIESSLDILNKISAEIKSLNIDTCAPIDDYKLENYYMLLNTSNLDITETVNILMKLKQYNNCIPTKAIVSKDIQNDLIKL